MADDLYPNTTFTVKLGFFFRPTAEIPVLFPLWVAPGDHWRCPQLPNSWVLFLTGNEPGKEGADHESCLVALHNMIIKLSHRMASSRRTPIHRRQHRAIPLAFGPKSAVGVIPLCCFHRILCAFYRDLTPTLHSVFLPLNFTSQARTLTSPNGSKRNGRSLGY